MGHAMQSCESAELEVGREMRSLVLAPAHWGEFTIKALRNELMPYLHFQLVNDCCASDHTALQLRDQFLHLLHFYLDQLKVQFGVRNGILFHDLYSDGQIQELLLIHAD